MTEQACYCERHSEVTFCKNEGYCVNSKSYKSKQQGMTEDKRDIAVNELIGILIEEAWSCDYEAAANKILDELIKEGLINI